MRKNKKMLLQDVCKDLCKRRGYTYGEIINLSILGQSRTPCPVKYRNGVEYFFTRYFPYVARKEKVLSKRIIKGEAVIHLAKFSKGYFIYYPGQSGESIVPPLSMGVIDYDEPDGGGHEGVPLYLQEKSHSSIVRNKKK